MDDRPKRVSERIYKDTAVRILVVNQKNYPTNSMELSPSWEAASRSVTQEFTSNFMEPGGSLPCSQEPTTGPYPETDRSSTYHSILSLQDPF
jgi:hypothetical protein